MPDSPLADAMELTEQIAASDKPFALFLDDLHEVHNADILGLLSRLLSVLGPGQRLVVGTRELPMLDIHRLRANGKAVELDARKLRFSLEETRDLSAPGPARHAARGRHAVPTRTHRRVGGSRSVGRAGADRQSGKSSGIAGRFTFGRTER